MLIPTHDHGPTLRHAVASALGQTVDDLQVVIVGDGMPPAAAAVAREVAASDPRVSLRELEKGERHGEGHRHLVLGESEARHVFYLADDDLWFPEHVETLGALLDAGADFVAGRQAALLRDGRWTLAAVDLRLEAHRELMRGDFNRVGLSDVAHSLEAYRRLPHGWRPAPRDVPTDLHMWRQWLDEPWVRYAAAPGPTGLHFPSPDRRGAGPEERAAELLRYMPVLTDPVARRDWLMQVVVDGFGRAAWLETHWRSLEGWLENREAALTWHAERLAEAADALAWYRSHAGS